MEKHQNSSDCSSGIQHSDECSEGPMDMQESSTCKEQTQDEKYSDSDSDVVETESSGMEESNGFHKVKIRIINEKTDSEIDDSNGFHKVVLGDDFSDIPYRRLHDVDEKDLQKIKNFSNPELDINSGACELNTSYSTQNMEARKNCSVSSMELNVPFNDGKAVSTDIEIAEQNEQSEETSDESRETTVRCRVVADNEKDIDDLGKEITDKEARGERNERSKSVSSSLVKRPYSEPTIQHNILRHRIDPEPSRSYPENDQLSNTLEEEITPRGTKEKHKIALIRAALESDPVDIAALRKLAISPGGLVNKNMRQRVWPLLINANTKTIEPKPSQEEMEAMAKTYSQVVMDVNRSSSRFPPGIDDHVRMSMKDKLVDLIMRVMIKRQQLKYYQGFHDVCITFLLCMDEDLAFAMVDKLAMGYMREYLDETMERTSLLLNFVYPLVNKCNPELCAHMQKCDLGTIFALSWVITWFSHVLGDIKRILRVFDFFLASHRMMPIYLSAAFVLHREQDIYDAGDEMGYIHKCLSTIPNDLPLESLLQRAGDLYLLYPPAEISQDPMLQNMNRQVHDHFNRIENRTAARRMAQPANDAGGQMFVRATLWTVTAVVGLAVAVLYHSYMGEDWSLADIWRLFS